MQPTSRCSGFEVRTEAAEPPDVFCDLASLIVEGRVPRVDGRGYGEGPHVPQNSGKPLLGQQRHICSEESIMVRNATILRNPMFLLRNLCRN